MVDLAARGKRLIAQKLAKNVPLDAIFIVLAAWQQNNLFHKRNKKNAPSYFKFKDNRLEWIWKEKLVLKPKPTTAWKFDSLKGFEIAQN